MRTKGQTTYVLLERGVEDVELVDELTRLLGEGSIYANYEKYPTVVALMQGVRNEVRAQREDDE